MKKINIVFVFVTTLILIAIASMRDNNSTDNTYKAIKIDYPVKSGAKISPLNNQSKVKKENIDIETQKKDVDILVAGPKKQIRPYTPIIKTMENESHLSEVPPSEKISDPKVATKQNNEPLKVNYSIGVKYKQVESLVAQDNYLGFSFKETHNEFNGKIALTDKKYFVELNLSSIDNGTMAVSYLNYGIALGHNLNDKLELGLEYQKNNLVYRSDYHLNFEQVSQAGISAKYEISDADNYKINSKAKYLYAEKDTQREFLLNLEIPMNKIDLGIGYGINDRESNIDNSYYKGNYKRKDEILEFGVNYKF